MKTSYLDRMQRISAGLLLHRHHNGVMEVLLAHPGGPFWKNKDAGAWTIPKGEPEPGEDLLAAAVREFAEEIGTVPAGPFMTLTPIRQKSGKRVHAWAVEGDCDPHNIRGGTFKLEWPPRSGKFQSCVEIDRAEFFSLADARVKINPAQVAFLEELELQLGRAGR
jgi:predicted NUDIX family NTP pyrophosphohydrolase